MSVSELISELLLQIGENPTRPGLVETPNRAARAWEFWTSGYKQDPASVIKSFEDGAQGYDTLLFQGNIPMFSICEHHLCPFFGVVHIGLMPSGKIPGLSKLARLVDIFARRLQVQERLTTEVAESLSNNLATKGVGVVVRARHLCMESRGVQRIGTLTYTSSLLGCFRTDMGARQEFFYLVERADGKLTHV